MSNNLNKKLLAEAFDAIVNDNDVAKSHRLFKRYWDLAAKNSYALLEAADEEFEISDMGDDFNNDMVDEIGSDAEEKFNQAQIAVDELEDKFPAEVTDEIKAKFDDVRNILDEMKLAEDEEADGLAEDASVALEDLKGEFEMAGEIDDEISDLFDEISAVVQGEDDLADAEMDEEDVADEDFESDEEMSDDMVDEAVDDMDDESSDESSDDELEIDDEGSDEDFDMDDESSEEDYDDVQKDEDELIDDIKMSAEDLAALIDELEAVEGNEKEAVDESWSKISDPRKKMTSEEEGINKKGTMNFGKLPGMKLNSKAGLGSTASVSKGQEPSAKVKMCPIENKGAKSWHKVEKPANKASSDKSLMGK